jgi:hypothetical protein
LNKVLEFGRIVYNNGRYEESKTVMTNFYKICVEKKNISKALLALWLIFLINVLDSNWDEVYETLDLITFNIDNLGDNLDESMKKINADYAEKVQLDYRQVLISRGYLLNWGLFLLKDNKNGLERYLNLLFNDRNLLIVENSFKNLIKYGIVLALISRSRKNVSIIKNHFFNTSINENSDKTNECYFNLFESLYYNFNLDNVRTHIAECKKVKNIINNA